ncbi:MAG TPA: DUF2959 family protein [Verrucomicrobiae bacterium]|nr:DUF2959 family protein [Verrucomicrobiae bacterium]
MKKKMLLNIGLLALVVSATQAQEHLATSIQEARAETANTSRQLSATVAALNALAAQKKGDLRPTYSSFAEAIPKTTAAAETTAARVKWMDGDGQAYFKEWQDKITGIANESLRKKSQKRLEAVRSSFDKVKWELKQASERFKPFLSDLSDIQKTLEADVTAAGVKSVRPTVKSANTNYKPVNQSINAAIKEMDKMAKALSSQAK